MKTLAELAIDHDYYCSDNNYYDNKAGETFDTFSHFLLEYKDADMDYNLPFRWDIKPRYKDGEHEGTVIGYYMEVFIMQQRKGKFWPIMINIVEEKDVPDIIDYLETAWKKLQTIWTPIK